MSSRQGYQQSGEFDECGEFDDISRQDQNSAESAQDKATNKVVKSTNTANLANMANLTIFCQRPKCNRMSSRQGYQQSGEFDECGEFDNILLKTKMQANELKTRVPTKWRI